MLSLALPAECTTRHTSGSCVHDHDHLTVDGATVSDDVEPRMLLVQYLREKLGKTGTVIGCDTSNCGACTVHLDGAA